LTHVNSDVVSQFEITPKAFANFSPAVGAAATTLG
jgi:hypothetical protein